jgi:hypothetical protein
MEDMVRSYASPGWIVGFSGQSLPILTPLPTYSEIIVKRDLPSGHLAVARDLCPREFRGDSLLRAGVPSAFVS